MDTIKFNDCVDGDESPDGDDTSWDEGYEVGYNAGWQDGYDHAQSEVEDGDVNGESDDGADPV